MQGEFRENSISDFSTRNWAVWTKTQLGWNPEVFVRCPEMGAKYEL